MAENEEKKKLIRHIPKFVLIWCRMSTIWNNINVRITYEKSILLQIPMWKKNKSLFADTSVDAAILSTCHVKFPIVNTVNAKRFYDRIGNFIGAKWTTYSFFPHMYISNFVLIYTITNVPEKFHRIFQFSCKSVVQLFSYSIWYIFLITTVHDVDEKCIYFLLFSSLHLKMCE